MVAEFTNVSQKDKIKLLRRALAFCLSLVVILSALICFKSSVVSVYAGKTNRKLPVYRVDRDDKKISISFDCAWGVDYTDGILDELDRFGVKCTFFVVKFWVEKYPDYVKKIIERGHEIGTHSSTHPHMSKLSKAAIEIELLDSVKAIEDLTGKKVELFRAPFGEYTDTVITTAESLNLLTIQWDVDSLDWKDLSKEKIAERVIKKAKIGSIILCHNNGKHTLEALPLIFSTLISSGYEFLPISELVYKSDYVIDSLGEQKRNQ